MNSYDLYIILRGLGELLTPFVPLVIAVAIGIFALLGLRLWLRSRKNPLPDGRQEQRLEDMERRIGALEGTHRESNGT